MSPRVIAKSLAFALVAATGAAAQAIPAAVGSPRAPGFSLPTTAGSLHYSVSASETISLGYQGQNTTATTSNLSGNLGYLSGSETHPFSALYSAGYLFSNGTGGVPSSTFQTLGLSQIVTAGRYSIILADNVSYLPTAAAAGLSGIPGVGDANLPPGQFLTGTQGVLSNYATRIDNTASGSISRALTGKTSLTGRATYAVDRFLGTQTYGAIESNSYSYILGAEHRLDARTTYGVNGNFARYVYLGQNISTDSQGVSAEFSRQLSRRASISLSAGPEYITSNTPLIPSRLSFIASTGFSYTSRDSGFTVGYGRSTGSGSGVIAGALTDSITGAYQRRFGPSLQATSSVTYLRTQSLSQAPGLNFKSNAIIGGVQVNRAIVRNVSLYGSYTLERQNYNGSTAGNFTFNGLTQILGFGVTYSPESLHVGRR